jgi:hypothetical protein
VEHESDDYGVGGADRGDRDLLGYGCEGRQVAESDLEDEVADYQEAVAVWRLV